MTRAFLAPTIAALMAAPSWASSQFDLSSTPFDIGTTATVTVEGVEQTSFWLMFDTEPGDYTLPGGAWIGLGFSNDYAILDRGQLPAGGLYDYHIGIPDDPSLVGLAFYLQAAGLEPGAAYLTTSRRLDVTVGDGEGGQVSGVRPETAYGVRPEAPLEVHVQGRLDDQTVTEGAVIVRRLDDGTELPTSLSLIERSTESVVLVAPDEPLPAGCEIELAVTDALRDESGAPLSGTRKFRWMVHARQHPVLFNTPDEVELFRDRIERGVQPWSESFSELLDEAEGEAMRHNPDPHRGKPPTGWNSYVDVYVRWFTSSRYAQDLGMAYLVTGDTRYAEKAKEILKAWLIYEPAVVGKWFWVIQTDIAGLGYIDAVDLLWEYPGLSNAEREQFRAFLNGLGDACRDWQMDDKDKDPENIRSWTNTMIASVGYFNDRQDLVDFAIEHDGGNPFPYLDLFDRGMAPDGEMYDSIRKSEQPYYEVTYPIYHLQAWALLSEMSLHHGRDLYNLRNADGNTQLVGWEYYVPYLTKEKYVKGLTDTIIRDFCISKYYPVQRIFRTREIDDLFDLYGGEPLYETHIRKRSATFSHKTPLVGSDDDAPGRPGDVVGIGVGATSLHLVWAPPAASDEGDLAAYYIVLRDGSEVARVSETSWADAGLTPGSSYLYEVRAVDYAGNVGNGRQKVVTTESVD